MTPISQRRTLRIASEIYYRTSEQIMVAEVATSGGFRVSSRRELLKWNDRVDWHARYDVAPDGRLLLIKPLEEETKITVIANWATQVRARLAAEKH